MSWIWEIVLYDRIFCSGERETKEAALEAATKYADYNLTHNTRQDAHFEVYEDDTR